MSRRREWSRNIAVVVYGIIALLLLMPVSVRVDENTVERCGLPVFDMFEHPDLPCTDGARHRIGWVTLVLLVAAPATVVYLDSRPAE